MVREDLNDEGVKDFEYFLEMGHHLQKINHLRLFLEHLRFRLHRSFLIASAFSQ